ncbi:MAG: hypothetical protein ACM3PP_05130 [Candidatus Saccharibacteria bacterium]
MVGFFKSKHSNNDHFDEAYLALRKQAFSVKPEQVGITLEKKDQVYGTVVDMGVGGSDIATMVCFLGETASLYFSKGGGIIGAGQHENVKQAVALYLASAQKMLPVMKLTDDFSTVPAEDHHVFYFFTGNGTYLYDLDLKEYQRSRENQLLFSMAQMVLTEIRQASTSK